MQRTFVYIDGFNLYYRLLKKAPQYRWLNVLKLSQAVLRDENRVEQVNYYTASVSAKIDADAPGKQRTYLNALATVPEVAIHRGNFMVNDKWVKAKAPAGVPDYVKASISEEKGSDVNLASHLVRDAFQGKFDVAAVITNDTDVVEPIRIVVQEVGLPVGILTPVENPAKSLKQVVSFMRHIRSGHLVAAQFPDAIPDTDSVKPVSWISSEDENPVG